MRANIHICSKNILPFNCKMHCWAKTSCTCGQSVMSAWPLWPRSARLLLSLSESLSSPASTSGSCKYRKLQKKLEKRNEPYLTQIQKMVLKSVRAKQWCILIQSRYFWTNSAVTDFSKFSARITKGTVGETNTYSKSDASTTHFVPKRKQ